ncbi:hypothetical protein [Microbacterium sp. NPDC096154]|uniref:IS1096 element passenger TnpR family protein n=1 Tax=Microbacterium sp. NPDC096154 TaxID=3155549 RepID=UPI003318CD9C
MSRDLTSCLPQLISGERRAPFEDSGGRTGYEEIAAILADDSHPEYGSTKAWVATAVGRGPQVTSRMPIWMARAVSLPHSSGRRHPTSQDWWMPPPV